MLNIEALNKIRQEVGAGVSIVPATKTVSAQIIGELKAHDIFAAGENRVQEFLGKIDEVEGMDWHFIGQLQTNKVRQIIDKVVMIQSVDRVALVDEIARQCTKNALKMDILVEFNAGEASKGGATQADLDGLIGYILDKPQLVLRGLMCVPAVDAQPIVYQKVGEIFRDLGRQIKGFDILSMGMSADYLRAVEHGANMIRPGSILFGQR